MAKRKLRAGMVGGGPGAFIGEVHRKAMRMDGKIEIAAGAFSADPAKSRQTGGELNLDPSRVYGSYQEMMETESRLPESERMDFVAIVTPNHLHFGPARLALEKGFHVVCDKPLAYSLKEGVELARMVQKTKKVFALTHNYTGYPMVKEARSRIGSGSLGKVIKVVVEYPQGWLLKTIERQGQKQAGWRTDPKRSGLSNCMGDIGTHCENLANYITGLEIKSVCADLTIAGKGRRLDNDGNVLLRFHGGAKGVLHASQISFGEENGLNIRVYCEKGRLFWKQEDPARLWLQEEGKPLMKLTPGNAYLCKAAMRATRLPAGHPEAFIEAFANIYVNFADTVLALEAGRKPAALELDFPTVEDGVRGLAFVKAVVANGYNDRQKWTEVL